MKRAVAALVLLFAPALAQSAPDDRLYAEGRYDAAIAAGLARKDAHGFNDAARATLAEEASREQRCLPCLKKAEDYARRAIAADPANADARVYLAIALGLEARIEGYGVARRKGYASEAKDSLDAALQSEPKNVWALAGLGGWNIEVVRGGGKVLAYVLYGASVERGRQSFAAAFAEAPDNLAIRYQYALTLAGYDDERFHPEIEDALTRVVNGKTDVAYVRLLQKRAGELLKLMRSQERKAFQQTVRRYEGYP